MTAEVVRHPRSMKPMMVMEMVRGPIELVVRPNVVMTTVTAMTMTRLRRNGHPAHDQQRSSNDGDISDTFHLSFSFIQRC